MAKTFFNGNAPEPPDGIFVDQAGYRPGCRKIAALTFPADHFSVVNENGDIVYEHEVTHFGHDECSGDDVYIADLTAFDAPGTYRVRAGGRTSARFRIGEGVYKNVFFSIIKAFYYLRCGCGLEERHAGKFTHAPCHTAPAEIFGEGTFTDVSGGWHDAGDYGRYVTAGACACAQLLYAYKLFPKAFDGLDLNIPESGTGIPDILEECRYELEWLMKMQKEDGSVYHKVTTMLHAPFVMPEDDTDRMYVFPVSTSATADLCAVCALASGIYAPFDKPFAEKLKAAATRAFDYLLEHPDTIKFKNPEGCNTGEYGEYDDTDNRYWAAAEMFVLTGSKQAHAEFERTGGQLAGMPTYLRTSFGHWAVGGFGSLAYILDEHPDKNETRAQELMGFINGEAYWLTDKAAENGYCAAMNCDDFFWGSNMRMMHNAMLMIFAFRFTGNRKFLRYAEDQIHVLLGRNPLGISYVTGCGEYCCNDPHLRPAYADGIDECIPGMVCGGPNHDLNDWKAKELIPGDTPPMKCFADNKDCFSLNEVTIYWNAAAAVVLAFLNSDESR